MTKEQEEAIKKLVNMKKENESLAMRISNNRLDFRIVWSESDLKNMAKTFQECAKKIQAIETVLSMLEEISQLKKGINSLMLSRGKWKNRYYKTRNKLKEKDEQIELMAKFIAQTEIDELICKDIEYCIADDEYSNCYRCIKQYFENKVKER